MSEPENGEEARRMRAVGDEQPDVPAPGRWSSMSWTAST